MCHNCKADAKIWVDSYSCDCVDGNVDCGYDDRNGVAATRGY